MEQSSHQYTPCRRLGGPMVPIRNYMMQASRDQRSKLFIKEIAQEIEKFNGPGPCEFAHLNRDKIRFSEKN